MYLIKGLIKIVQVVLAIIFAPLFILGGIIADKINRFSDFSLIIAYIPFYFGEYIRYFYYKSLLRFVGKKVIFKFGSYCQYRDTSIGNNTLIGFFNALGEVEIGSDVLLGGYINITSGLNQHSFDISGKKIREQPGKRKRILIGSDCWIGNNALICANVHSRSVVGAGSVVIKELEGNAVFVGNPAKKLKTIE